MLYIGADHRGYYLKEQIKKYLDEKKIVYKDIGNSAYVPDDDYPDFSFRLAREVIKRPIHRGILICGSGIGSSIAANKVRGIRSAVVSDTKQTLATRRDNNANIISLSGDSLNIQKARNIIDVFLSTSFSLEKRHRRRVEKIQRIEHGIWGLKKQRNTLRLSRPF